MARAATSPELALFRTDGQVTRFGLAFYNPSPVLTATVSGSPASLDNLQQVAITITSGSPDAVLDGMTVLVGSGSGGYDIGITRAVSSGSAALNIGSTSDIPFAAGQYISVLPDWSIWARKLALIGGVWNIEGDVTYTDQNDVQDPVPVLGPIAAVLQLSGSTVSLQPTAAASWTPASDSVASYLWTAPGTSATSGLTTATPTLTYNATGQYVIHCTITGSNGKTATGHRYVFVVNDATGAGMSTEFSIDSVSGDMSSGGWKFDVVMDDKATYQYIRDRAFVVLFARDWYGSTESEIGPIAGYENVVAVGWIEGQSVHVDPEQNAVTFTVSGPAAWMQKVSSWPISVIDSETAATDWITMQGLTVDRGVWHLTHWRSTVDKICDVIPSYDTRRSFNCSAGAGTLWDQLKQFCDAKILATPGVDRYGRLIFQIDPQVLPAATRNTLPVVMEITKQDWAEAIDLKQVLPTTALLETAGFAYIGSVWTVVMCRASGNSMARLGSGLASRFNLQFADQTSGNALSAAIYAKMNNPYPAIEIALAQNNRLIDIVPQQYVTLSIAADDTERGIVWVSKRLIPRRVEFKFESGTLSTTLECEAETVPGNAVAIIPPATPAPGDPVTPTIPTFPTIPTLPGSPRDPIAYSCAGNIAASGNGPFYIAFSPTLVSSGSSAISYFPCAVRLSGAYYPTELRMDGASFNGDAASNCTISAVDSGGGALVAGTYVGSSTWRFSPLSSTSVAGFKVSLSAGGASSYSTGAFLGSGAIPLTDPNGTTVTGLEIGKYYCIEANGGPAYYYLATYIRYQFSLSNDGGSTWNGILGWGDTFNGGYPPQLTMPSWGGYAEYIDGLRARLYWQATTTSIKIRFSDSLLDYADNVGGLNYILRKANYLSDRSIALNPCSLYNVCDP